MPVGQKGALPVTLEREQSLGKSVCISLPAGIAAVFSEHTNYVRLGVPTQRAPDNLVDIVVTTFRIGDETYGVGLQEAKYLRLSERTRVDHLPGFGDRVGHVPIRNRILALPAVRDVGIVTDRILARNRGPQLRQAEAHLRAENNAAEPGGLLVWKDVEKLVRTLTAAALECNPHLRLGMIAAMGLRLLYQLRHR